MNYSNIKYCDIANGEGVRTTLFVSGCSHHCKGCFQPETWAFDNGKEFTGPVENEIITSLDYGYIDGLTILGGEPMEPENQRGLVDFVERIKDAYPDKTIWCFTGDLYEDLVDPESPRHTEVTDRLLDALDILVDGPFEQDLYSVTLRFMGSSNQRIIDLDETRKAGMVVLWKDDPMYATHEMV